MTYKLNDRAVAGYNPSCESDGYDLHLYNNNLNDFYSSSNVLIDKNTEKLLITEIMPNPSEGSEWFELYNPTNSRINLNGLKICDGLGSTHCYYFAKDDYIDSGYKTYDKGQTKITLNDSGDYLTLSNASDEVIMETDGFEGADDGISFSLFGIDWKWTKSATKGSTNIFEDIVEVEEGRQKGKAENNQENDKKESRYNRGRRQ
jgi:hypothetical protein